jgi:hypothetical protein
MTISSFQPMQVFEAASRVAAERPAQPQALDAAKAPEVISQEELRFFTQLYPEQSKEISAYSTYSRDGISQEHSVGSLIDKKS